MAVEHDHAGVTESDAIYEALSAPFEKEYQLSRGGKDFSYGEGHDYIERLNKVLGADGWDSQIVAHGADGDSVWVQMRITARFPEGPVFHEQFGECIMTRGMDVGNARKGACTDALKKTAMLFGVGLYLTDGDDQRSAKQQPAPRQQQQNRPAQQEPQMNPAQQQHHAAEVQQHVEQQQAADEAFGPKDKFGWPICQTVIDLASDPYGVEAEARKRKQPRDLQLIQFAERVRVIEELPKLSKVKEEIKKAADAGSLEKSALVQLNWLLRNRHRFITGGESAAQ